MVARFDVDCPYCGNPAFATLRGYVCRTAHTCPHCHETYEVLVDFKPELRRVCKNFSKQFIDRHTEAE